jgi:hypothetical protein
MNTMQSIARTNDVDKFYRFITKLSIAFVAMFFFQEVALAQAQGTNDPYDFSLDDKARDGIGKSLLTFWKGIQTWALIATLPVSIIIFGFLKGRGAWFIFIIFIIIVFGLTFIDGIAGLVGIELPKIDET